MQRLRLSKVLAAVMAAVMLLGSLDTVTAYASGYGTGTQENITSDAQTELLQISGTGRATTVASSFTIPDNYNLAVDLQGNGSTQSSLTYTLKKGNTYYIEIAGGQGKMDSWVHIGWQSEDATVENGGRTDTEGGKGGYQVLCVTPNRDVTLTLYAGGAGKWGGEGGNPDGQAGGGGGSSSIWYGTGSSKVLIAAAGGGGGASGGTSGMVGYDGGDGTGTNDATHDTVYTAFNGKHNGTNGRTWWGWYNQADTSAGDIPSGYTNETNWKNTWQSKIISDVNTYDGGNELTTGMDRLSFWSSFMSADTFWSKFLLYSSYDYPTGGGGGFPTGSASYYHWAGWLIGSNGWEWVESSRKGDVAGTGGKGYTMSASKALSSYGLNYTYEAKDGANEGEGYVKIWAEAYILTIDPNGGVYDQSMSVTQKTEMCLDTYTVLTPTREGYTFLGWERTGGGIYNESTGVYTFQKVNETFTAKWDEDIYTITYDLQGGSVSTPNPSTYTYKTNTFTLNNPTRAGYLFLGWIGTNGTGPNSATPNITIPKGSTGNRSYQAQWQKLAELPLVGTPNLSYKPITKTAGGSNTVVSLNQGGVDLSWTGFTVSGPMYNVYYRLKGSGTYIKYNTALIATGMKTQAFNNSTAGDMAVYDKANPDAPDSSNIVVSGNYAVVTWNIPADNGTAYQFRVDAIDEYSVLEPWQKILNTAGYTVAQAKQCTSFAAMMSNTSYLDKIMASQTAMNLLKEYYAKELNSMIDTSYSDKLNLLNYQLGLKCYLVRNGVPFSTLLGKGSYSYGYVHAIGGTAAWGSAGYNKDHDADRFTTVSGKLWLPDMDNDHVAYKWNGAINLNRYNGGTFHIEGSFGYYKTGQIGWSTKPDNFMYMEDSYQENKWNGTDSGRTSVWSADTRFNDGTIQSLGFANIMCYEGSNAINYSWTINTTSTAAYFAFDSNHSEDYITNMYLAPASVSSNANAGASTQTAQYVSNEAEVNIVTGVKGYLYIVDNIKGTVVAWTNGSWTTSNSLSVARKTTQQYLHIAAVDNAGNISTTYTVAINGQEAPVTVKYNITFDGNGNTGGSMGSQEAKLDTPVTLLQNSFVRTGYIFTNWNTEKDGSGTTYADKQTVVNIAPGLPDISGGTVTLYAQWEPIHYIIRYHANNGTSVYYDQECTYDEMVTILGGDRFSYEGHEFIGWGMAAGYDMTNYISKIKYMPGVTTGNLSDTDGTIIHLYGIWLDHGITVTGTVKNERRATSVTFRAGERASITWVAEGWPVNVTLQFPDEWNEYLTSQTEEIYDVIYEFNGAAYTQTNTYYFMVPLDTDVAVKGETYPVIITAENIFGETDEYIVYLTIENISITNEIRDRLR